MTYASAKLLELRDYLKPRTGLDNIELGIVGDEDHDGGYHHGWDNRRIRNGQTSDYSWTESTRDSSHRTNAAAAIDIGMFARLRELSNWLVGQCEAQAPDTQDIRSIIYSPDGNVVRRWDRLRRRSTGDSTHLSHTHVSFFRDAENNDKISPFQRFFEGGTVSQTDIHVEYMTWRIEAMAHGFDIIRAGPEEGQPIWYVQTLKRIEAAIAEIGTPPPAEIDPTVLASAIKTALLDPQVLTAIAIAVADEDHARSEKR